MIYIDNNDLLSKVKDMLGDGAPCAQASVLKQQYKAAKRRPGMDDTHVGPQQEDFNANSTFILVSQYLNVLDLHLFVWFSNSVSLPIKFSYLFHAYIFQIP